MDGFNEVGWRIPVRSLQVVGLAGLVDSLGRVGNDIDDCGSRCYCRRYGGLHARARKGRCRCGSPCSGNGRCGRGEDADDLFTNDLLRPERGSRFKSSFLVDAETELVLCNIRAVVGVLCILLEPRRGICPCDA